ncbi:MAG: ribonuclease P protein component [Phycisphaerales bacterium]|nr:MAG: ribonuclease P protein component [Phycisphaerales bacterium]
MGKVRPSDVPGLWLKGDRAFRRILGNGRRASDARLTVLIEDNGSSRSRLGIRVGRQVGKAVFRTRVRRRLREAFRRNLDRIPAGIDIVCIVRPGWNCAYADLAASLISLTVKAARRSRRMPRPYRPR